MLRPGSVEFEPIVLIEVSLFCPNRESSIEKVGFAVIVCGVLVGAMVGKDVVGTLVDGALVDGVLVGEIVVGKDEGLDERRTSFTDTRASTVGA